MKKRVLLSILLLISTTVFTGRVSAIPIEVSIDAPSFVKGGSNFNIDINISGLLSNGHLLGAFSLDFYFNPNDAIAFLPHLTSFGDELGAPGAEAIVGLDAFDMGGNTTKLEMFEVSLLFDFELASLQTDDSITLISLGFYATDLSENFNQKVSLLANNFVISDAYGNDISALIQNPEIGGDLTVIPEPATLLLMVVGLLGVGLRQRSI